MTAPAPPILRLLDVAKRYDTAEGPLLAIEGVSFDVRPGEIISVIGPSGCGKTTLFNIIGGLTGDYDGQVLIDGGAQTDARAPHRQIGMVFQEESNFPWRTTLQNVALPLEAAGMPRGERLERARHFIRLVGL